MSIQEIIDAIRPSMLPSLDAAVIPKDHQLVPVLHLREALPDRAGHVGMADLPSLVAYVERQFTSDTAIFASEKARVITAVLDWHNRVSGYGSLARHTATLPLEYTEQFLAWRSIDRKPLAQVGFAEFVEEHLDDVAAPAPAELLEVATTLSGKKSVAFQNATRLQNGAIGLQWEETIAARAGERGDLTVPAEITLQLPIFKGCEAATTYQIRTLLRYRIESGKLAFEVRMLGLERIHTMAFDHVVEDLRAEIAKVDSLIPVYSGQVHTKPLQAYLP